MSHFLEIGSLSFDLSPDNVQCIQVLFKMLFFDEFLLFLRRGGLLSEQVKENIE